MSLLLITKEFIEVDECSYYNTDPIQMDFKCSLCNGKAEEGMWMEGTSDSHVYSNIGGIDQPTYFSKLTHCSLNWETEGNVLFKIENPAKPQM